MDMFDAASLVCVLPDYSKLNEVVCALCHAVAMLGISFLSLCALCFVLGLSNVQEMMSAYRE